MDIERIRELVQLMVDNELSELDIQSGEDRVALKRGGGQVVQVAATAGPAVVAPPAAAAAPAAPAEPAEELLAIVSPMVGTFYAAPSPESPAYVQIGADVDNETVVCIVEAMKVMNEIKAEVRGVIAKVLVNNGEAVEYGQPLFMVKPN